MQYTMYSIKVNAVSLILSSFIINIVEAALMNIKIKLAVLASLFMAGNIFQFSVLMSLNLTVGRSNKMYFE